MQVLGTSNVTLAGIGARPVVALWGGAPVTISVPRRICLLSLAAVVPLVPVLVVPCAGAGTCSLVPACLVPGLFTNWTWRLLVLT